MAQLALFLVGGETANALGPEMSGLWSDVGPRVAWRMAAASVVDFLVLPGPVSAFASWWGDSAGKGARRSPHDLAGH